MIPTRPIMAMAVASAPTTTDVRESDAVRLRQASSPATLRPTTHPGRAVHRDHHRRRGHRGGADREQRGDVSTHRIAAQRRRLRRRQRQTANPADHSRSAPPPQARMVFVGAAAHGLGRRHLHGFARRRQRGEERHQRAGQDADPRLRAR